MEAELLEVKREIAAIKYLLSARSVGDPENPYIKVYEQYAIEELKIIMNHLQTEKHDLQTEKNILLQLVATQTSAGKLSHLLMFFCTYYFSFSYCDSCSTSSNANIFQQCIYSSLQ
jgi:hypothetical protein